MNLHRIIRSNPRLFLVYLCLVVASLDCPADPAPRPEPATALVSPAAGATIDFPHTFRWEHAPDAERLYLVFATEPVDTATKQTTAMLRVDETEQAYAVTARDWSFVQSRLGYGPEYFWTLVWAEGDDVTMHEDWVGFRVEGG